LIEIDGSLGEGGGQILRTSIAFSALTEKDVRISNIRAKRRNPGLNYQHMASIKAVAQLCGAEVLGLSLGSKEITFKPRKPKAGKIKLAIGTAGSISLVLQSLMIACSECESKVILEITGGTNVSWSPPIDYLSHVTLPILSRFGYNGKVEVLKRGFYPKGGGKVQAIIEPHSLSKIELLERGKLNSIEGVSVSANLPISVSKRMTKSCSELLTSKSIPKIRNENVESFSPGAAIIVWAEYENTVLGADSLGKKGKPAEIVGKEAAQVLMREMDEKSCVDTHMADQIIPYLALAGGKVRTESLSKHAETNLLVVNEFMENKLEFSGGIVHGK
jgi:RNA 3'-phosphate cyclase